VLNWALNRPGQLWAPDESQQGSPGPELNGQMIQMFRSGASAKETKKRKKEKKQKTKRAQEILLCLPLM
jgi:hypothetical protein